MADHEPEGIRREMSRAVADAIIDALETATLSLANAIRTVRDDQAEARETLHALNQRVEALEQLIQARTDHLA